jgi:hypothetical protein
VNEVQQNAKNDATEVCAQILKGIPGTGKDVGSEHAQVMNHHESHEGIAAAASSISPDEFRLRTDKPRR